MTAKPEAAAEVLAEMKQIKCNWPDCGHDTNGVGYSPGCTGAYCTKPTDTSNIIESLAIEVGAVVGYERPGGPVAEVSFSRLQLHEFVARIERALSAQGEAVRPAGYVCDFEPADTMESTFYPLAAGESIPHGCTAMYTHPAPSRVTVNSEMLEQARRAYSSKCGQGTSKAAMFSALKAALEVSHG